VGRQAALQCYVRVLTGILLLLLLLTLQPGTALAHPEVLRSDPPAGGIVDAAPPVVTITFTEPVESRLLDITVVSESGSRIDLGDAKRLDDARQVQVGLGGASQGGYVVRWRALGFDGHIVAGVFNFGVGRAPTAQATNPARAPISEALTRWVTLLACCLLVGGVAFRQLVLAPLARSSPAFASLLPKVEERLLSLVWAGFSIFLGASVVLLATQTLAAGRETGLSKLGEVLLGSRFGQLWIARMALLSALGAALAHFEPPSADATTAPPRPGRRKRARAAGQSRGISASVRPLVLAPLGLRLPLISALVADPARPPTVVGSRPDDGDGGAASLGPITQLDRSRERWWWVAMALGGALLLLFSLGGHPAVTDAAVLAIPIDWIHRAAAILWIGGAFYVAVLWLAGYMSRDTLLALLRRFSAIAVICVAVLIPTGLFAAWLYIPSPADTPDSPYGVVLLVKLALVVGMGALGILHWRTARAPDRMSPRLSRTLVTEALLGASVLAAVGLLVNLSPPVGQSQARQAAGAAAPASGQTTSADVLTLAANAGPNLVSLTIDPPRPGNSRLRIDIIDDVGRPVEDATVFVRPSQPNGQATDTSLVAVRQASGRYGTDWAAAPGHWNVDVSVTRAGQAEAVAAFSVDLPVAGARDILRRSDQAMNQLQSAREHQVIDGGAGNTLDVNYTYVAPGSMRAADNTGIEIIAALDQRYERRGADWQVEPWPDPRGFKWPIYAYANLTTDVKLLGMDQLDGRPQFILAFTDGAGVRYTFWVDTETYLINRQQMLAPGHYMTSTFADFNGDLSVDPPDVAASP
jgi:putative copper export protein/methionine-rich copper-binding protein CopC